MNLTKDVQNLYREHSKTLLRKIKEDLNKWMRITDIPCSGVRRFHSVNMNRSEDLMQPQTKPEQSFW